MRKKNCNIYLLYKNDIKKLHTLVGAIFCGCPHLLSDYAHIKNPRAVPHAANQCTIRCENVDNPIYSCVSFRYSLYTNAIRVTYLWNS